VDFVSEFSQIVSQVARKKRRLLSESIFLKNYEPATKEEFAALTSKMLDGAQVTSENAEFVKIKNPKKPDENIFFLVKRRDAQATKKPVIAFGNLLFRAVTGKQFAIKNHFLSEEGDLLIKWDQGLNSSTDNAPLMNLDKLSLDEISKVAYALGAEFVFGEPDSSNTNHFGKLRDGKYLPVAVDRNPGHGYEADDDLAFFGSRNSCDFVRTILAGEEEKEPEKLSAAAINAESMIGDNTVEKKLENLSAAAINAESMIANNLNQELQNLEKWVEEQVQKISNSDKTFEEKSALVADIQKKAEAKTKELDKETNELLLENYKKFIVEKNKLLLADATNIITETSTSLEPAIIEKLQGKTQTEFWQDAKVYGQTIKPDLVEKITQNVQENEKTAFAFIYFVEGVKQAIKLLKDQKFITEFTQKFNKELQENAQLKANAGAAAEADSEGQDEKLREDQEGILMLAGTLAVNANLAAEIFAPFFEIQKSLKDAILEARKTLSGGASSAPEANSAQQLAQSQQQERGSGGPSS